MAKKPFQSSKNPRLGEYFFKLKKFKHLDHRLSPFKTEEFEKKNSDEKGNGVSRLLADLILDADEPVFLLGAVVDYITRIQKENILPSYVFSSFELWLTQTSLFNLEDQSRIRGKIAGKWVPREAYQIYFPIGMGKTYPGTHFVTAHHSPDLDTTVGSFWGWVDAFAAQVGTGLHIWNIPGGPVGTQVEVTLLFQHIFGEGVFDCLAKNRLSLTLTSLDLMTQKGMLRRHLDDLALNFDHERQRHAVVLIDNDGYYIGDWRPIDVEGVRQVIMSFNNCLMWFESHLHIELISCFAEKKVTIDSVYKRIRSLLDMKMSDSAFAKQLPSKELDYLNEYLVKVLEVDQGMKAPFEKVALAIENIQVANFTQILCWLRSLLKSELFDSEGVLTENRPQIFNQLEILVKLLSDAFQAIRVYIDRLNIAFRIKTDVFGFIPQSLSYRTDIEEIRSKMGEYSYLTVNQTDSQGRLLPIGVVYANDLQKETLGTVTLRDFCNREEMKIPSYLQVISVVDHHRATLVTQVPPRVVISDAQSSNVMIAKMAFEINDQYGLGGMSEKEIEKQLAFLSKIPLSLQEIRIYGRLLRKKKILQKKPFFYICPQREMIEYLHFIYAILDDTDLLTKVSRIDVECVASLLNRLKSLTLKKEVEIIHFDDLPENEDFTAKAAVRLLQNEDFYSLYSKVYVSKEQGVDENLQKCLEGKESNIFMDTKILNGCSRVGQTKIFAGNDVVFQKVAFELRDQWSAHAASLYSHRRELLLHLHLISTIPSAQELFEGKPLFYKHLDEMWVWVPPVELAFEKLKLFLNAFKGSPAAEKLFFEVEFLGKNGQELSQIFKESFFPINHTFSQGLSGPPIAVLRYNAGGLNSRKTMIAPFLPRLN